VLMLPVLVIPLVVVAPVTPRVPPTVALLVTPTELRVAAPDVFKVESEVFPVTPKVPPTVALFVIVAELRVAAPDVLRVPVPMFPVLVMPLVVVAPVTPRVPATVASLFTVKLSAVTSAAVKITGKHSAISTAAMVDFKNVLQALCFMTIPSFTDFRIGFDIAGSAAIKCVKGKVIPMTSPIDEFSANSHRKRYLFNPGLL
jgi:hypothetical protein